MPVISGGNVIDIETQLTRILAKSSALSSGDFNGVAEKGQLAIDFGAGKLYINTGTKAATVWTVVGAQT